MPLHLHIYTHATNLQSSIPLCVLYVPTPAARLQISSVYTPAAHRQSSYLYTSTSTRFDCKSPALPTPILEILPASNTSACLPYFSSLHAFITQLQLSSCTPLHLPACAACPPVHF